MSLKDFGKLNVLGYSVKDKLFEVVPMSKWLKADQECYLRQHVSNWVIFDVFATQEEAEEKMHNLEAAQNRKEP